MNGAPSRVTLTAFGGTVLIGGSNFVAVKFSNEELAPLYGAAIRFTGAAAIFWLLTIVLSVPLPRGRAAVGDAVYGSLAVGAAYALLYFALTEITIGMAAVTMATVPLFTLILAVFHGQERLTAGGVVGALLAIVGIGVLSLSSLAGAASALHIVAAVGAAAAVAESSVLVKGFPRAHPVTTNAIGMVTGGLLLWAGSALMSEPWTVPRLSGTWAAVSWLVTAGSVGLFGLLLFVIRHWTASAAVYCAALMPVVAVALGALLASEPITLQVVAGATLVLLAVYLGAIRRPHARRQLRRCGREPGHDHQDCRH